MSDFAHVPAEDRPQSTLDQDPHPDDPSILSPADVAERLGGDGASDEFSVSAASDERRCAWLTGGGRPDERYVLNWSGPLDSNYDYVTFGFDMYANGQMNSVTDDGGFGYAWQWACRGSSYETSWTPANLKSHNGFNPRAVYAVWRNRGGGYWGEAPCN